MTKLDAVNLILRKAGGMPVESLDTNGASDQAEAERCLDEEELRIQSEWWHYNTVKNVELTPDSNGYVFMPDGALTIDSDSSDVWRDITQRGGRLYDLDNNTYAFTETLLVTYRLRFDFDCIPLPIRTYIAWQAAHTFYTNKDPAKQKWIRLQTLENGLKTVKTKALQFNDDSADHNTLNTPEARKVRGRSTTSRPVIDENG